MSRIDDRLLDCSVYLYPTRTDAERGERIGGTGFLVAMPGFGAGWLLDVPCLRGDFFHLYVVTNRHLLASRDHDFKPKPVVRLNTCDGGIDVIPAQVEDWAYSEEHDLAVLPIPYRKHFKYRAISPNNFLTKDTAAKRDVGIGDEVFMVGRFVSHDGKQRNLPSARFGHISMMPFEKVYHPSNASGLQESYLVEIHALSGYSGSPVFVRPFVTPKYTPLEYTANTNVYSFSSPSPLPTLGGGPWLLGVEWGYMGTHKQEQNNTGVAGVVPAWRLLELLNTERLVMQRKLEQEAERKGTKNDGAVETDLP